MQVKLKKEWGDKVKGAIVSISSDRAYLLMKHGTAIEDRSFIAMYEKANPIEEPKPKKKKKEKFENEKITLE